MRKLTVMAAAPVATIALLGAAATPAQAAAAADWQHGDIASGSEGGSIWYNRSVGLQGHVWNVGDGSTTVFFLPYYGANAQFERAESRFVHEGDRPFNFVIDGSDLVGGFSKVEVKTCWNPSTGGERCRSFSILTRP